MITVGSKVKINVDVLFKKNFEHLNEAEISFIKENKDTVFEVYSRLDSSFCYIEYPYVLSAKELENKGFKSSELILVEENA